MRRWLTSRVFGIFCLLLFCELTSTAGGFASSWVRAQEAAYPQDLEQLSAKLRDNAAKQQELLAKIADLNQQALTLQNQIAYMDNQIYLTALRIEESITLIAEKEQEITILTGEIGDLAYRIDRLGGALEFQRGVLGQRARERYKRSRLTAFELFFGSQDFGELLARSKYLAVMEQQDQEMLDQIKVTKADYHGQKILLEKKREQVEALKAEIENQRVILEARKLELDQQKASKEDLLRLTKNDESRFQGMLAEARAEQAAIEKALSTFISDLIESGVPEGQTVARGAVIGIQGSTGYSTGDHVHFGVYTKCGDSWCHQNPRPFLESGQLRWPLDEFQVSQEYGATPEAQYLYTSKFHNGIDIYGSVNSSVKAAADGTISYSIDSYGGKGAIIYHNENLMTLYWHLK